MDVWAEVFVAVENTWVSVDCVQGFVNKPFECETQATQPLLYVVGFDNGKRLIVYGRINVCNIECENLCCCASAHNCT